MDKIENAKEIVTKLNNHLNKTSINVPILNNLNLVNQIDDNIIFVAVGNGIVEQFLSGGKLNSDENIDDRINSLKKSIDNSKLIYYKSYNKEFNYKIYLQDINVESRLIRQINAYFVNKDSIFYQISLAIGPFEITDKYKRLEDITNIDEDSIVKNLFSSLKTILYGTCYIDDIGGK